MKRQLSLALISIAIAGAAATTLAQNTATAPAAATTAQNRELIDVPVRRVVLFSSGVGFFQHAGKIRGNAATELRFKTDQINDILKSLVVSDSSGGQVRSITYGSQNPVSRTLKSFQIDISTNPSLAGILNQIRGSKVILTLPDDKVEGMILGVEEKERPVGPVNSPDQRVVKESYVNVITAGGIRSVQLDAVKNLQIQDEALQNELDQALAALAQARDKDKKPVIINFDGTGERPVSIAYLVETPVWKTSYRLILPDPTSQDSATLLGWAIVENQTDNDWNNVTLDLVGGRPISFIQDLYQPLYVPRPRVQPKTYASLTPQTYEDGVDAMADRIALQQQTAGGFRGRGGAGGGGGGAGGGRGGGGGFGGGGGAFTGASPADAASIMAQTESLASDFSQGVRSIADAGKVGEMFQYSVPGVTLPRQRSSMIPIISGRLPFDRVSIYNAGVMARSALLGVRLKNETTNYILAGPLTVLDKVKKADGNFVDSYAGDASVDDAPAGQERLLSYAVDQELLVDATKREAGTRLMTGSIMQGVLHLKYTDVTSQQYLLENKSDHDKAVIIEQPFTPDYVLKEPAKPLEKTDKAYRFEVKVPPKTTGTFDVREERIRGEEFAILNLDLGVIDAYARTGEIPASVKTALGKVAEKRRVMAEFEHKLQLREQDRNRIMQDLVSIREDIRVLPSGSKSSQDRITELTSKNESLRGIDKEMDSLRASAEKARTDLIAFLDDMTVE